MPRYKVNRSDGWPVNHNGLAQYPLGAEFDSDAPEDAAGVTQGYLLICGQPVDAGGAPITPAPDADDPSTWVVGTSKKKDKPEPQRDAPND